MFCGTKDFVSLLRIAVTIVFKSLTDISFRVECSIFSSTKEKYEIFRPSVRIALYLGNGLIKY